MHYLIETTVIWTLLYLIYYWFFKKTTFFNYNRYYLLGALLLGLVFPMISPFIVVVNEGNLLSSFWVETIIVSANALEKNLAESVLTGTMHGSIEGLVIWSIYWLVLLLMFYNFIHSLMKLYRLKQKSRVIKKSNHHLVLTETFHLPFSFFKNLYWSKNYQLKREKEREIIKHELVHIGQWHSLDVVFVSILKIIFWFNPILYLYQKSIQNNHEYLADNKVLEDTDRTQYANLLLQQFKVARHPLPVNYFNNAQLKNRIIMMNQKKSSSLSQIRYLLLIPILASLLLFFKCQVEETIPPNTTTLSQTDKHGHTDTIMDQKEEIIYTKVDQMAMFKSCETLGSKEEQLECSTQSLLQYVYKNISYPEEDIRQRLEGMAVVRFVVDKEGKVQDPEMLKSLSPKIDENILQLIENMPDWIPAQKDGQKVSVYYILPVKFKLE